MRALITNDDGVESAGIRTLTVAALEAGLDCVVAAPMVDFSGASASLTAVLEQDGRFLLDERTLEGLPGVKAWAVQAAPAFIVRAALTGAFGDPPDVVLSGINHGPNTGYAILHSGTVGATLTAAAEGRPGLAVSLDLRETSTTAYWDTASAVAAAGLAWVLRNAEPLVLNLNIPNIPLDALHGMRRAQLAPFGAVQTVVAESGAGYVKLAYEESQAQSEPDTDVAMLADGWATYTPLRPVCAAEAPDLLDVGALLALPSPR